MFTVGQKVCCIDGKFNLAIAKFYVGLPKEGQIYTIRSVSIGISPAGEEGEIAVTLRELINPKSSKPPHPERAFNAMRFRPLTEAEESEWNTESKGVGKEEAEEVLTP